MKIMQVLPELNSGGVEQVTLGLAHHLASAGHQSCVLSKGGKLVAELEAGGSQHYALDVHRKNPLSLRHVPAIKRLLQETQPDILHLRSRAPAWLCYLTWKQLPVATRPRLVTTVHGFYSVNFYSSIMTQGEAVICVSDSVQDYVRDNYPKVPAERLHLIHEGVDPAQFPHGHQPSSNWQSDWFQEFPATKGKRLLVLPGRITRLKGHHTFLQLIADLKETHPEVHGLIVGGAHAKKTKYLEELHQQARELGIEDRITFTGKRADLRDILALSEFSFSLSQQPESFGLTVLEALSLGKPVIGYAEGGVAEILAELFPLGAIPRDRPETLLELTRQFLTDPPTVANKDAFSSETAHRKTLQCYQHLLHPPA